MTTGFSFSTSSLRSRLFVTAAVPQPSLMIEMCSPLVSRTSCHTRGPSPLSITCVRPVCDGRSKTRIKLFQFLLCLILNLLVEGLAVRVDADRERPEVLDA